jgi:hypothetical protein
MFDSIAHTEKVCSGGWLSQNLPIPAARLMMGLRPADFACFRSRKVRDLLFKEKLKKGAVKGGIPAAEDFENQICRLGDTNRGGGKKTPSLHRLGGGVQQEKSTLFFRGLNPRFFLGLDDKNVCALCDSKMQKYFGLWKKKTPDLVSIGENTKYM